MSKYKISEEEKALFRQAVKTMGEEPTKPRQSERNLRHPERSKGHPITGAEPSERRSLTTLEMTVSDGYQTELSAQTALYYKQSAIEKNQLDRFKHGKLSIEGKLDLHGYTSEQAKSALLHFLTHHLSLGHRTLLIIHGKGKPERPSQLKNLINHWLPQIPDVLAFISAQPKDGGTGALYVLLKKR